MKKRMVMLCMVSLILVGVLFLGDTYSIFSTGDIDENANVYTTGNLNITYTLSEENVLIDDSSPLSDEESIKVTPYRITIKNIGSVAYKFNVLLNDTTSNDKINYKYIMTQVGKNSPKSLDSCSNNIIIKNVVVDANSEVSVDVRVWLSDRIPNSEIGKSFYSKLSISGIATYDEGESVDKDLLIADRVMLASDYVKELYNDGSKINEVVLGVEMNKGMVYQNSKQGILLDNNNEYRYYGSNPNNYISFNNELWRIISVSDVYSEDNSEKTDRRLKIIRDSYLKDIPKYKNNNFVMGEINTYLNEYYYKTIATRSKGFVDKSLYYLGGIDDKYYASDSYIRERGFKVYNCESESCGGIRDSKINTFVGLMYASDYLYATDLSVCFFDGSLYNNDGCYTTDWLNKEAEMTMTPSFNNALDTFAINDNKLMAVKGGLKIRPVLYLKKNIAILSGNGSKERPFTIDLIKVK
ncbi:MAG: hypothetical protein VZS44_01065 [Bacilli bacterium]|nr:hypothetical protein [Bacilli bacterium]